MYAHKLCPGDGKTQSGGYQTNFTKFLNEIQLWRYACPGEPKKKSLKNLSLRILFECVK